MSALTLIPNVIHNQNHNSLSVRRAYHRAAGSLNMTARQLQYLLLSVGLLSVGTMLLTYPM